MDSQKIEAFKKRIRLLRGKLKASRLDAILVSHLPNIQYLSGFTGSSGLSLISIERCLLIIYPLYELQAAQESVGFEVITTKDILKCVIKLIKKLNLRRLAVEGARLSVKAFQSLCKGLRNNVEVLSKDGIVESLRMIKDEGEIELMKQAARLTDEVFRNILTLIKPGVAERELALEIDYQLKRKGAEELPFRYIIVAAGERAAMPHGRPSERTIKAGELVCIDFGAKVSGYCSDFTRTIAIGKISKDIKEAYQVVLSAQSHAIENIKPNIKVKQADSFARDYIKNMGYGKYFIHGLGHGVGLEVHELPRLAQDSKERIKAGMVVTVEPGVYLPNNFGIRIEDMVLVSDDGCKPFSKVGRQLIVL